jgi:hypothetical protein
VAAINFITSFFSDIESTFVVPGTGVWTSGPFARWLALAFGLTHVAALVSVAIPECYVMSAMMFIGLMTNLETIIDADKTNVPFVISSVIAFVANALAVLFYLFTRYNQVGLAGLTGGTTAAKVGFYLSFGLRILLVLCMLIGSMLELSEVPEQAYVYKSASFLTIAFVGFLAVFEPVSGMVAALLILPGRSLALSRLPAGVAKNAYVGDTMVVVGLGGIALVALLSIPVLLNSSVFTAPWADEGDDAGDADPHHKGDGNSSHKALLGAAPTEGPDGSQSYGSADKSPA